MGLQSFLLTASLALLANASPILLAPRAVSCPGANDSLFTVPATGTSYRVQCSTDYYGNDMPGNPVWVGSLDACITACDSKQGCKAVAWVSKDGGCYLKSAAGTASANGNVWAAKFNAAGTPKATSPSAPAPTIVAAPGSGKRGLAYNDASLTSITSGTNSKLTWAYNWFSAPGAGQNKALTFIPMLWSDRADHTTPWAANANAAIAAGANTLLAFNEPDQCGGGGSCMPMANAVAAYKKYMQPFAGKAKLGAPAVTNGGGTMGLNWLKTFITQCTGCTIDVIPIHWYDSATNVAYFKNHIQDAYKAGGNRPLWITEFGASGTEAQKIEFLKQVMPWLDSLSYVQRYSYFMDSKGILVNSNGAGMTPLGQVFDSY